MCCVLIPFALKAQANSTEFQDFKTKKKYETAKIGILFAVILSFLSTVQIEKRKKRHSRAQQPAGLNGPEMKTNTCKETEKKGMAKN